MSSDPRPRNASEDSPQDLGNRKRRSDEALEHTSGVPLALFGTCDPVVEAQLIDDTVELLRYMSENDGLLPSGPPPQPLEENEITSEDIQNLLIALEKIESKAPPNLLENLPREHLWILADIAMVGSGLARHRATLELGDILHDLWQYEGVDSSLLEKLAHMLDSAPKKSERPVVFNALRTAVSRALDRRSRLDPGQEI